MIEGHEDLKIEESASLKIRTLRIKERKPRGRPLKFRKEMLKDAELLAGLGFTEEDFVGYWGVHRSTYYRWKAKNEGELCDAIRRGRLNADITATKRLWERVERGDLDAIWKWLTSRRPNTWKPERTQRDVNISNAFSIKTGREQESEMRDRVRNFNKEENEEFGRIWKKVKEELKKKTIRPGEQGP